MHSITPITGGNYTRCLGAIKAAGVAVPVAVAVVEEQRFVLNDAESRDARLLLKRKREKEGEIQRATITS